MIKQLLYMCISIQVEKTFSSTYERVYLQLNIRIYLYMYIVYVCIFYKPKKKKPKIFRAMDNCRL